jgi:hypothetical protein
MSSINNGNQILTYDYRQLIKSQEFNMLNYKLHTKGIYEGALLTKVTDSEIKVSPFVCLYEDETSSVSVKIQTLSDASVSVSASNVWVIGRFIWLNTEDNYMDIIAVAKEDVQETDMVFGRLQYDGSTLTTNFDYSQTSYNSKYELKLHEAFPFRVYPTHPNGTTVEVDLGGPIYAYGKEIKFDVKKISPAFTLPVTNGRKDLVCIDSNDLLVKIVQGVDSSSPTISEMNEHYIPVAIITFPSGANKVKGSYINYIHPNNFKTSSLSPLTTMNAVKALDNPGSGLNGFALDGYSHHNIKSSIISLATSRWGSGLSPGSYAFTRISYGNGLYVATHGVNDSTLATSTDGFTWTTRTHPDTTTRIRNLSVYANGIWVLVGDMAASSSTDGINWTTRAMSISSNWTGIAYGNERFLCVNAGSNRHLAGVSTDGITWNSKNMQNSNPHWGGVAFGDGKFVVVTNSTSNYATYGDGIGNWTQSTLHVSSDWNSIVYGNGVFVAANSLRQVARSVDGIVWTLHDLPVNSSFTGPRISYGNGLFIVVYDTTVSGEYSVSKDGINWTQRSIGADVTRQFGVGYGAGRFVVSGFASGRRFFSSTPISQYIN